MQTLNDLPLKANQNTAGHMPDPLYVPGLDAGIPTSG